MLSLYGEPGSVEGENVHHADETFIRSDMEDRHADIQKTRGEFLVMRYCRNQWTFSTNLDFICS